MASEFENQLRAELAGIQAEITRLENKRRLIEELLASDGASAPAAEVSPRRTRRRAARRGAPATTTRKRRPRGLITGKVREFLAAQSEPAHATEILAYLEKSDAAPQSSKPLPTLQSTLQRMKEMGEIENRGRNRWALISSGNGSATDSPASPPSLASPASPASPAPAARADGPPVVTSTTTFGSARPGTSQ